MSDLNYNELLIKLLDNLKNDLKNRYFIALSGPPASGKSTISEKLLKDLTLKDTTLVYFKWMVSIMMTKF